MKHDVAFFHPATKTMIEADLLFNLPPTEQVRRVHFGHHQARRAHGMTIALDNVHRLRT